ncbi:MAG: segregation and condensation protein A [Bradymonadia bacterium]
MSSPRFQVDAGAVAVQVASFEGPLDLLLHLIRKEEFDVFDLPIAPLTAAYLRHLEAMRQISIEPAGEFLVMAATLTQIKSRLLLPRAPKGDDGEDDGLDPRADLVRLLLEYQRYQEVAEGLDACDQVGRDVFLRPDGLDRPPEEEEALAEQQIFRLGETFRRLIARKRFVAPHEIYVERVSIGERVAQIAERLAEVGRTSFEALCDEAHSLEEQVTTFLAVLEMSRLKLIKLIQGDRLAPLYVESVVDAIAPIAEEAAGTLSF